MRQVARFRAVADTGAVSAFDLVMDAVARWKSWKFDIGADGTATPRRGSRAVVVEQDRQDLGDTELEILTIVEAVTGGSFETAVKVLRKAGALHFQCVLAAGSDGDVRSPAVVVRPPRLVQEVLGLGLTWWSSVGTERVFAQHFDVDASGVEDLVQLIDSPDRRLPVLLVSEFQGRTVAGDLHERLALDACGLAHTCRLSAGASWELTHRVGKEWSCYNGAVRLFWPFRVSRTNYRAHPLWTFDRIVNSGGTELDAQEALRGELVQRLLEASTFTPDDPVFAGFERERARRALATGRSAADESGDYRALADLYAGENDRLREELAAKSALVEQLRSQVEALTLAPEAVPQQGTDGAAAEVSPQSVADALAMARAEAGNLLVFPDDMDATVAELDAAAGPPDKILRYLRGLAELSSALGSGRPLGRSIPIWLRGRNVDCSGESETTNSSVEARRRRTFRIDGKGTFCEFHAKPANHTSPDSCVRIYFTTAATPPHVRIGYVGRHF